MFMVAFLGEVVEALSLCDALLPCLNTAYGWLKLDAVEYMDDGLISFVAAFFLSGVSGRWGSWACIFCKYDCDLESCMPGLPGDGGGAWAGGPV